MLTQTVASERPGSCRCGSMPLFFPQDVVSAFRQICGEFKAQHNCVQQLLWAYHAIPMLGLNSQGHFLAFKFQIYNLVAHLQPRLVQRRAPDMLSIFVASTALETIGFLVLRLVVESR